MTIEAAKKLAKSKLSQKRYIHTKNVAKAAEELALRYGVDPQKAQLAAWLHDIVKEESKEELLRRMQQDGIIAASTFERPFAIWHGPCGALYARQECNVEDKEILDAIECHTTGKAGMSRMDKVIFLADKISAERDFVGVEEVRALAKEDLDKAVEAALRQTVQYLQDTGKPVDNETQETLADLEHH